MEVSELGSRTGTQALFLVVQVPVRYLYSPPPMKVNLMTRYRQWNSQTLWRFSTKGDRRQAWPLDGNPSRSPYPDDLGGSVSPQSLSPHPPDVWRGQKSTGDCRGGYKETWHYWTTLIKINISALSKGCRSHRPLRWHGKKGNAIAPFSFRL